MFFSCWYIFDYFCSVLTKNFKYSGNIQLFGDTFTNNLDFFSFISSFSSLRFVSFFSIVFIRHHRNKKKRDVNCCLVFVVVVVVFPRGLVPENTIWMMERTKEKERIKKSNEFTEYRIRKQRQQRENEKKIENFLPKFIILVFILF